jgi:hypothetical protein
MRMTAQWMAIQSVSGLPALGRRQQSLRGS